MIDQHFFEEVARVVAQLHQNAQAVGADGVSLGLFQRRVMFLQRFVHGEVGAAGDVVGPESVCQLVHENPREVRLEPDSTRLLGNQHLFGDRLQVRLELGPDDVAQHHLLRALGLPDAGVVREVERDRLHAGPRLSRPIDQVDHRNRGGKVAVEVLMIVGDRERPLESREPRREAGQQFAGHRVLESDERLERRLVAEQSVLVHLVRTDRRLDQVALEPHPRDLAVEVVVGEERLGPQPQEALEGRIVGVLRRVPQCYRRGFQPVHVSLGVGNRPEAAVVTLDHRVVGGERRGVSPVEPDPLLELFLRHVLRVRTRAARLRTDSGHERLLLRDPVPRPVHQLVVVADRRCLGRILGRQHRARVRISTPHLQTVDRVELIRGFNEPLQDALLSIVQERSVEVQRHGRELRDPVRHRAPGFRGDLRLSVSAARRRQRHSDQRHRARRSLHASPPCLSRSLRTAVTTNRAKPPHTNSSTRTIVTIPLVVMYPPSLARASGHSHQSPNASRTVVPRPVKSFHRVIGKTGSPLLLPAPVRLTQTTSPR